MRVTERLCEGSFLWLPPFWVVTGGEKKIVTHNGNELSGLKDQFKEKLSIINTPNTGWELKNSKKA